MDVTTSSKKSFCTRLTMQNHLGHRDSRTKAIYGESGTRKISTRVIRGDSLRVRPIVCLCANEMPLSALHGGCVAHWITRRNIYSWRVWVYAVMNEHNYARIAWCEMDFGCAKRCGFFGSEWVWNDWVCIINWYRLRSVKKPWLFLGSILSIVYKTFVKNIWNYIPIIKTKISKMPIVSIVVGKFNYFSLRNKYRNKYRNKFCISNIEHRTQLPSRPSIVYKTKNVFFPFFCLINTI